MSYGFIPLFRSWSAWCYAEKRKFKQLKISTDDRNILINKEEILCCLCGKSVELNQRVIHNCHLTGEILGVAHSECNLRAKTTQFLPIFFHNLSRYDAHHIIKNFKLNDGEKLSAIVKIDKTYISFSLDIAMERFKSKVGQIVVLYHSLHFFESFQFMSQSLDSLAKTVDQSDFELLRTGFPNIGDKLFGNLTKKGFFPYNYLASFEKFTDTFLSHGPPWYNTLTKSIEVTKEQHNFALGVNNAIKCKTLGDYHDIYLRTDVFFLADIFQTFREAFMQVYKLHPAQFIQHPT